jgi:hypothetical protein
MQYLPTHEFSENIPFIQGILKRELDLFIFESRGGLGKTHLINTVFKEAEEEPLMFSGHATPLKIYYEAYKNPHKVIVFDDVDSMLYNKSVVALMKQLCQIGEDKLISYSTTAKYHGENIPRTFISNNKVIILCNNIKKGGADMDALISRSTYIRFNPDNETVLNKLKEFAQDKEVLNWFEQNLKHFNEPLNFRIYELAVSYKNLKLDWRSIITKIYGLSEEFKLVSELMNKPYKEAVKVWLKTTGKSESTYKRRLQEYKEANKKK